MSSSRNNDSCIAFGTVSFLRSHFSKLPKTGSNEQLDMKAKPTNLKKEEHLEKHRLKIYNEKLQKEQDKEKEQERKIVKRKKSWFSSNANAIESFRTALSSTPKSKVQSQFERNNIPIFLHKCIQFIEEEGLDSEGIYRVPGNRVHVDLLLKKFDEDSNVDIKSLGVSVNAVATALKNFVSKGYPPIFDKEVIDEVEEIAGLRNTPPTYNLSSSMKAQTDANCRLISLRNLLKKLPDVKFAILKLIFQHFVQVAGNSKLNSMDSRNLAICWWPTLIPIEFTNIGYFEQLRPYLEDIIQTMIDQFAYCFCDKEEVSTV